MQDIECVFESVTGTGSIFISNLPAAQNVPLLHSKGIRAILSVARCGLLQHTKQDIPHYLYIPADDHEEYLLNIFFEQTFNFIEKARKQTNVLVHCMAGVSRSVTIAIAYLLKKYKYTLEQVISMMHRRRRKINPNKGFIEQLKRYAESQGIKCDLNSNFLRSLKERSCSKSKKSSKSSTESGLSRTSALSLNSPIQHQDRFMQSQLITTFKYQQEKSGLKSSCMQMRKIKSFEENRTPFDQNNQENAVEKQIADMIELKIAADIKQSTTASENNPRRTSSIEDKIRRIRDKIMKKEEENNHSRIRSNLHHSPIYRKTHRPLENSSLEKQNKGNTQIELSQTQTKTNIRIISHSCNQQPQSPIYTKPLASLSYNRSIQLMTQPEQNAKDLFSSDLKIEASLYSHHRLSKRGNNRVSQDIHN